MQSWRGSLILLSIAWGLVGCGFPNTSVTPTVAPTKLAQMTHTASVIAPTPSLVKSPTISPPTHTPSSTNTAQSSPTNTATMTPQATAIPTSTHTPIPSSPTALIVTKIITVTLTPSLTNTVSPTPPPSPTQTNTPKPTETAQPSATASSPPTLTPQPTVTPAPTITAAQPSATASSPPTLTPAPANIIVTAAVALPVAVPSPPIETSQAAEVVCVATTHDRDVEVRVGASRERSVRHYIKTPTDFVIVGYHIHKDGSLSWRLQIPNAPVAEQDRYWILAEDMTPKPGYSCDQLPLVPDSPRIIWTATPTPTSTIAPTDVPPIINPELTSPPERTREARP